MYTIRLISVFQKCTCDRCACPNNCSPKAMYKVDYKAIDNVVANNADIIMNDNNRSEIMCAKCCDRYTGSKITSGNYHGVNMISEEIKR